MKDIQKGSVSLFVVIFSTLLITVVTVGFIKIMISGQQQSIATNLSQSAYDSAQTGVEDGKRALAKYRNDCLNRSTPECDTMKQIMMTCQSTAIIGASIIDGGTEVQTSKNNIYDQAYTCVKINLDTDDYLGYSVQNQNSLIPLIGVGQFNKVKIEWFTKKDLGNIALDIPNFNNYAQLPPLNEWTLGRPPIMRAQIIQTSGDVLLDNAAGFLYPTKGGGEFTINLPSPDNPTRVKCDMTQASGYACSATINVDPIANTKYLNIVPIYDDTNYRITLWNQSTSIKFDGVQPEIDSTGRANDLFRRVSTRIDFGNDFPYPRYAVDVTNNFCKSVLTTSSEYLDDTSCDPTKSD